MESVEKTIEKWLKKTVKVAIHHNNDYINKNKYTILDFVLYRYFNCYIIFCQLLRNAREVQEFSRDFFNEYTDYCSKNFGLSNEEADKFYWNRMEKYNQIMTSETEKREENLVFWYEQFVAKSLSGTPYEEQIVIVGMIKRLAIMKELHILNSKAIDATTKDLKKIFNYYM